MHFTVKPIMDATTICVTERQRSNRFLPLRVDPFPPQRLSPPDHNKTDTLYICMYLSCCRFACCGICCMATMFGRSHFHVSECSSGISDYGHSLNRVFLCVFRRNDFHGQGKSCNLQCKHIFYASPYYVSERQRTIRFLFAARCP